MRRYGALDGRSEPEKERYLQVAEREVDLDAEFLLGLALRRIGGTGLEPRLVVSGRMAEAPTLRPVRESALPMSSPPRVARLIPPRSEISVCRGDSGDAEDGREHNCEEGVSFLG